MGIQKPSDNYLPEIDGLRAWAVLSVLLYHFGMPGLTGGFIGVDIFFVISGYLITGIIHEKVRQDRFSLVDFYCRRAKRIMPALYTVILATIAAGFVILPPSELAALGKSALATFAFVSNIFFWLSIDYFAGPADEVPLLHTWSLGVEEQFYLFFPVLLIVTRRMALPWLIIVLVAILLCSLVLSATLTNIKPVAAFYLPITRIWELVVGALLAIVVMPRLRHRLLLEMIAWVGTALAVAPAFLYTEADPFPGLLAIPPVLGAAMLLYVFADGREVSITRLLSLPVVVFIGQLSYSLYLWHWPVVAYRNYLKVGEFSIFETVAAIALVFGLSVLAFRFIETPLRHRRIIATHRWRFLGQYMAPMVPIAGALAAIIILGGLPGRFDQKEVRYIEAAASYSALNHCLLTNDADLSPDDLCSIGVENGAPRYLLWGDSHAAALAPGVDAAAKSAGAGVLMGTYSGCPIAADMSFSPAPDWSPRCQEFNAMILDFAVTSKEVSDIILIMRWPFDKYDTEPTVLPIRLYSDAVAKASTPEENNRIWQRSFLRLVDRLEAAGKRLWIVGPVPPARYNIPKALLMNERFGDNLVITSSSDEFERRTSKSLQVLRKLDERDTIQLLWPARRLCSGGTCRVTSGDDILYVDDDHLSQVGAIAMEPLFRPIFDAKVSDRVLQ